jgi:hypothetical protein
VGVDKGLVQMLTQERIRELFDYRDGMLFWKTPPKYGKVCCGDLAGCSHNRGYWRIKISGRHYLAHRLIFLYHHGYMPENLVDHKDRTRTKNTIGNLREISTACNARNSKQASNNVSGVRGVSKTKTSTKWSAHICVLKKHIYVGSSDDFVEAVCLRLAAEQSLGWDGCDSTSPAFLYVKKYLSTRGGACAKH